VPRLFQSEAKKKLFEINPKSRSYLRANQNNLANNGEKFFHAQKKYIENPTPEKRMYTENDFSALVEKYADTSFTNISKKKYF
jgi:hypothetical protein